MVRKGKKRVAVARGGPSSEYEVSIKTGGEVLKHLPAHYRKFDVLIDKQGRWFMDGFPAGPEKILKSVDVVFNALHGEFGEDGKAQQVFELHGVPYTGSDTPSSFLAMNKGLARGAFLRAGIKVPRALVFKADDLFGFDTEDCAREIFNSMAPPWVVKPAAAGSSVGVSIADGFESLWQAVEKAAEYGSRILAEEYIKGKEATCGVVENFRNERLYALPPVEIVPPEGKFFDYQTKYDGTTKEICPAGFGQSIKRELEDAARRAHEILGLRHYSRADFIVSPRGIYLLEVNSLPGLTPESLLPKAAAAAGLEFPAFLDHVIQLALNKE